MHQHYCTCCYILCQCLHFQMEWVPSPRANVISNLSILPGRKDAHSLGGKAREICTHRSCKPAMAAPPVTCCGSPTISPGPRRELLHLHIASSIPPCSHCTAGCLHLGDTFRLHTCKKLFLWDVGVLCPCHHIVNLLFCATRAVYFNKQQENQSCHLPLQSKVLQKGDSCR